MAQIDPYRFKHPKNNIPEVWGPAPGPETAGRRRPEAAGRPEAGPSTTEGTGTGPRTAPSGAVARARLEKPPGRDAGIPGAAARRRGASAADGRKSGGAASAAASAARRKSDGAASAA